MKIEFLLANSDLFCAHCQDNYIKTPTILKGAGYYLFSNKNLTLNACSDCFARLENEVKK